MEEEVSYPPSPLFLDGSAREYGVALGTLDALGNVVDENGNVHMKYINAMKSQLESEAILKGFEV